MNDLEVEIFYSLSDPNSEEVLATVRRLAKEYSIEVKETLATVHRFRSWRRGVKAVPTIQVEGRTVWVGTAPEGMLERLFRELAGIEQEQANDL